MHLQKCCTIFREIMTPRTVSSVWELYNMEITFHFVFLAWHIILEYMRKTFCTSCNNHYWLSDLKKSLLSLRLVQRRINDNPITDYFEVRIRQILITSQWYHMHRKKVFHWNITWYCFNMLTVKTPLLNWIWQNAQQAYLQKILDVIFMLGH